MIPRLAAKKRRRKRKQKNTFFESWKSSRWLRLTLASSTPDRTQALLLHKPQHTKIATNFGQLFRTGKSTRLLSAPPANGSAFGGLVENPSVGKKLKS